MSTWSGFPYVAFVIDAHARRILRQAPSPRSERSAAPTTNALAETINGLYKTELIKPGEPWRSIEDVELATARWIDWFNDDDP